MTVIDEVYEIFENASDKIQEFLDSQQFSDVHGAIILKQEELSEKMYELDLELIKTQSDNLAQFDQQVAEMKKTAKEIIEELDAADDFITSAAKITKSIDRALTQIGRLFGN